MDIASNKMLILVAGVTGNIGQKLARAAIARGAQIRGLGRSKGKLDPDIKNKLESFVASSSWYDTVAIEKAVAGVDAVICAYSGIPELQLEGQLLLIRASERAGVKIYHAASWNYDFTKVKFGEHESYDPYISFKRHVELSSSINPIYVFTGVLAEVLFSVEGHGDFTPANHGAWDPKTRSLQLYGTGHEKYQWTTEEDAAEFSVALIMSDEVRGGQGGTFTFYSSEHSLREIAQTYEQVRGGQVNIETLGDVHDLEELAVKERNRLGPKRMWEYIGYFYQLYTVKGTWNLTNFHHIPGIKRTSLVEFLQQHPEIR